MNRLAMAYAVGPFHAAFAVLHGNWDGGETAVMGTTFTVIPWGRGQVSRGYREDGEQCRYRGTAVKWKRDEQ